MDIENDNLPSVSISAYCCIHLQSLLACVHKSKALAINRDHHTALLLFMQMERVDEWRGMKGIKQLGKNVTAPDKDWMCQWACILRARYTPKSTVQYFLRTDNQSHPQETLHISWNEIVKFLCSQDTNTGRHLERVT